MIISSILPADILIIIGILISMGFGYTLGFAKEFFSIVSFGVSITIALTALKETSLIANSFISIPLLADAAAFGVVFIVSMILCSIVSHQINKFLKKSPIAGLDRLLGLIYGFIRALAIIAALYILANWTIWNSGNQPMWVTNSKTKSLVEYSANLIIASIPKSMLAKLKFKITGNNSTLEDKITIDNNINDISEPPLSNSDTKQNEGYSESDRKAFERLLNMQKDRN
tara:strand:- start:1027 stop:1710 length:684 start_codon:yes stop_codon:yes gene_type:complete